MAVGGTAISTCPDDDTLAAVAELASAERALVIDHAASCESCRAIVGDLLGVGTKGSFAEAETLAASSASLPVAIPKTIDRYRIDRRIGAGAMGVVFAGYDPELARPVAIKVLRSGGSPERMKREAQALAQLAHPNVVAVYDVGEEEGSTFVAMALVDGDNLRTWLEAARTTEQIIDAIVQAARGLEVAHAAGIVHRDIKPDNIFVAKNGKVLVGDFGLARTSDEAPDTSDRESVLSSSDLTRTGTIVGTPAYMAPEQASGDAIAATDQFALCVTAWEALYGKRPFAGRDLGDLIRAVRAGAPPTPKTRSVPSHVRSAIRRGLAADPQDRHSSMSAFLAAMQPRKRWPYVAAGAVVLAIAATATALAMRETDEDRTAAAVKRCSLIERPSGWTVPTNLQPAAAEVLSRILDRYATEWQNFSQATCVAAARRELTGPAYAATERCLESRKETLLWAMSQGGDTLSLAESLEPIDTCRDLAPTAAPSPELATLQRDLAHAVVYVDHAPGRATNVEELLTRAVKLDDAGAIAQANYLVGVNRHALKGDASDVLRASITGAERAGDDQIRARASALLARVLVTKDLVSEAVVLRDAAVSAALRVDDPFTKIAVERAIADVARLRRNATEQAAAYRRIEAIQVAQFGELSNSLVYTRMMLAPILESAGKPDEAKQVNDVAMAGLRKLNGDSVEIELRTALEKIDDTTPAARIPLQEQIIAMVRLRGDNVELPKEVGRLGLFLEIAGDHARALAAYQEAITLAADPDEGDIESAVRNAVLAAERTDDAAVRKRYVDEGLALIERFPVHAKRENMQAHRGLLLFLAGRPLDALPILQASLAAAEKREPQFPAHIMNRSFALAQALWETGGVRDRDRARALAEQAERLIPQVRKEMEEYKAGVLLDRLEVFRVRLEAWRRTHR